MFVVAVALPERVIITVIQVKNKSKVYMKQVHLVLPGYIDNSKSQAIFVMIKGLSKCKQTIFTLPVCSCAVVLAKFKGCCRIPKGFPEIQSEVFTPMLNATMPQRE